MQPSKEKDTAMKNKAVMDAIHSHIFEHHMFPSVSQIAKITELSIDKCKAICRELEKQRQICYVFGGGKGLPEIVLPYNMMQGVLRTQPRPDWLENWSFSEKTELDEKITALYTEINRYEMFERLLYTGDIPLEDAIAFTLGWLEFTDVKHHKDDSDNPDITFRYKGKKVLVEVEGTRKATGKRKVAQLHGWIQRELEQGSRLEEIDGFLFVNPFKHLDPKERSPPLGSHAKEFLKLYSFKYCTTAFLYEVVVNVEKNKITKESARKKIGEGQSLE